MRRNPDQSLTVRVFVRRLDPRASFNLCRIKYQRQSRAVENEDPIMKRVFEIYTEFLKLGLTSFGGPSAHVAYFRDRFVSAKKWITEAEFAAILALAQFLPALAAVRWEWPSAGNAAGFPGR